ncbi:trigger factor [Mesomycoplasma flocculare]|uniref:trigger factor n=1 Tax=Mesomycoplasma flocculare TaxID=2128 RepID=UPI0013684ADC|nr:trigger factor [Mesomycoplasma flocculare]MXR05835.1 trigger factor [Mesomycoplasma flocculare]MXR12247.1 trigger factor [Mesomycoplasma flocculare]
MVTREFLPKSAELKIKLSADPKKWAEFYDKAEQRQAAKVSLRGFRKGKVPLEKARPYLNSQAVFQLALRMFLPELEKQAFTSVIDSDNVIESPVFNIVNMDKNNLEIEFLYPVYPEIKLPDYKNLKTKFIIKKITNKDIEKQKQKLLETKGKFVDVKRPAKAGDVIHFDFKGFIDDEPFEGGEAENFELRIGSNSFISGFEEQLIGLKIKEETDINVTFPKDYHVPAYANKQARFRVKINKIKENQPAKLTNDFVASLKIRDVETISQLEVYLKDLTQRENIERTRIDFQKNALAEIVNQVEIPLSRKLITTEINRLSETFNSTLTQQGFTLEEYCRITKFTEKDIDDQLEAEARKLLKNSFIFAEIAKLEGLVPTQQDYDEQIEKLAKFTGKSVQELNETIPHSEIQINITNKKVIDKLIEYNTEEKELKRKENKPKKNTEKLTKEKTN